MGNKGHPHGCGIGGCWGVGGGAPRAPNICRKQILKTHISEQIKKKDVPH